MKDKFLKAHMEVAYVYSRLSYCERRQVGCVIVDDDRIVSIGYNGTPSGFENVCEIGDITRPEVIHAEDNALKKLNYEATGMSLFVTTAPCMECADLIIKSKLAAVYYDEEYTSINGINKLNDIGIPTNKV